MVMKCLSAFWGYSQMMFIMLGVISEQLPFLLWILSRIYLKIDNFWRFVGTTQSYGGQSGCFRIKKAGNHWLRAQIKISISPYIQTASFELQDLPTFTDSSTEYFQSLNNFMTSTWDSIHRFSWHSHQSSTHKIFHPTNLDQQFFHHSFLEMLFVDLWNSKIKYKIFSTLHKKIHNIEW